MTLKQDLNWGYQAQYGVIIGFYGPKTGSKLGLLGLKRCQSCQIHQNCVSPVVIIGLGPNLGYRANNRVIIGF
jgi:hypothetical protein